jgi:hypothetical protein
MTVRGARWGLPWLCALALAAYVAYTITVALAGAASASDARLTTSVAQTHAHALVTEGRGGYLMPNTGDATCLAPLGASKSTDTGAPVLIAPPAWCRQ